MLRGRTASIAAAGATPEAAPPAAAMAEQLWVKSRSGAISGRGFHFQDVVGAWLAGRMLAGADTVEALVPEGFEDLHGEGTLDRFIQVKSRQERVGDFPAARAAEHVLGVWEQHRKRMRDGIEGQPLIIWERPVEGARFGRWGDSLDAGLAEDHPLRAEIGRRSLAHGLAPAELDELLHTMGGFVLSWGDALDQTISAVTGRTGLPRAAGVAIVQALRTAVADCVDRNAASNWSGRAGLTRTDIERLVTDAQQLVDRDSLEQALRSGVCEPVDFRTASPGADFFTGVDVQPGHVAAGLPVPRPDVTGRVLAALNDFRPALVSGPSGVGKSAVMWMSAYVTRNVLWHRVRRLEERDIEPLVRLVKALGPSPQAPVGLIVDAVGTGAMAAWDQLLGELTAIPGALLLGSVRNEDLLPIRTLPRCTVIDVTLDGQLAEKIHAGLTARGLTAAPHWREAFNDAQGLTLEYTYLLTKGRRLAEVISEQVNRRVMERRWLEIDILALSSVAHQWGARLDVSALERHLDAPRGDVRQAIQRLQDEHLIHVSHGAIDGLHQLRSRALSAAVHATPPPTIDETVESVVGLLDGTQLRSFVLGALTDRPDVDAALLRGLSSRMHAERSAAVWAEVLTALRLADFRRAATGWREVLDRHRVRPADRLVTMQQILVGGGIATELPDRVKPEIGAAVRDILARCDDASPLRDALLAAVGSRTLADVLLECTTAPQAARLIAATGGLDSPLTEANTSGRPLMRALQTCKPAELGELIKTAADTDPALGKTLSDLAGGDEALLRRFCGSYPWLVDLRIDVVDGDKVAVGRLLHVSDEIQGSPDTYVRELAKALLTCFPSCTRADVQAMHAGGAPITIRDHTSGVSHLQSRYVHTASSVAWARSRLRTGASIATDTDLTNRVHKVIHLLADAATFLDDLLQTWCQSRGKQKAAERLTARWRALDDAAAGLTRPLDRAEQAIVDSNDGPAPPLTDDAYTLVHGIVSLPDRIASGDNHASLATYAWDTLSSATQAVADTERWELAGLEGPPASLGRIRLLLLDLHAILAELAWGTLSPKQVQSDARQGPSQHALHRAADHARTLASLRREAQIARLEAAGIAEGLNLRIRVRPVTESSGVEWPPVTTALAVSVTNLEEWIGRLPVAVRLINQFLETPAFRPSVLVVPLIGERPLRQLAQQVRTDAWPGADLFDEWAAEFDPAWPTPLADAVAESTAALQIMSGLAVLPRKAWTQTHRELLGRQMERLSANIALLSDQTAPELGTVLADLTARVATELDADPPISDSFAGNLAQAVTGQPNDDLGLIVHMTLSAIERDIGQFAAPEPSA
jgi:hypothetical protein